MRIEYLADFPELVPIIAEWHHDQWSYMNPGRSMSERISEYRKQHGRRQIPTTVVALLEDQPVGSASLIENDMDTHEEYKGERVVVMEKRIAVDQQIN